VPGAAPVLPATKPGAAMTMSAPTLTPPTLLHTLSRYWWLVLLRGIAFIVFGVTAFMWPVTTIAVLVLLYGAFALVDGVLALAHAIMGGDIGSRWWLALIGVAGIAAGILTFMWPAVTALLLLTFIACWAIVLGVFQIAGAIKLRKEIDNEWTLILGGVLSILFGIVLLVAPGAGAVALIWVIAAYAVVFGVLLVMLALRLKRHQ
jgi:uncharacterized membrane protein HdeD (DUF308 family)